MGTNDFPLEWQSLFEGEPAPWFAQGSQAQTLLSRAQAWSITEYPRRDRCARCVPARLIFWWAVARVQPWRRSVRTARAVSPED